MLRAEEQKMLQKIDATRRRADDILKTKSFNEEKFKEVRKLFDKSKES
jgi:hypothetical protein